MATRMRTLLSRSFGDLRIHPIHKWVRATLDGETVASTTRAMVVWEPRRVVPAYAVPVADLVGELVPWAGEHGEEHPEPLGDGPPILTPTTPFTVHTCPGTPWTIRTAHGDLEGAAFEPEDRDLAGYVLLDWEAFSQWFEEEEPVVAHPHDPFDRIDCLRSTRHVVVSLDGQVLADTTRATLLFETPLPTRYYIPAEDVRTELLTPTATTTLCAYKGRASYWSVSVGDRTLTDLAWTYVDPLHDAVPVRDLVAFFTERVDLSVDGVEQKRPVTPWS